MTYIVDQITHIVNQITHIVNQITHIVNQITHMDVQIIGMTGQTGLPDCWTSCLAGGFITVIMLKSNDKGIAMAIAISTQNAILSILDGLVRYLAQFNPELTLLKAEKVPIKSRMLKMMATTRVGLRRLSKSPMAVIRSSSAKKGFIRSVVWPSFFIFARRSVFCSSTF
jgi:hypothetical protein